MYFTNTGQTYIMRAANHSVLQLQVFHMVLYRRAYPTGADLLLNDLELSDQFTSLTPDIHNFVYLEYMFGPPLLLIHFLGHTCCRYWSQHSM